MAAASKTAAPAVTVRSQTGNAAQLGALLAIASSVMFVATFAGAYVSVRNSIGIADFIPKGLKFDNFAGFMTMVSGLAAALSAHWALTSARLKQRRWSTAGYGLSAFFIVAALNSTWFLAQQTKLVAGSDAPYAILFYAFIASIIGCLVVGLIASIVNLIRVLGGHIDGDDLLIGKAGNWFIHLAAAAAAVNFFLIYTYK
jgi:heme/copper-type cytochrome/quinol oxidase subunit 3